MLEQNANVIATPKDAFGRSHKVTKGNNFLLMDIVK